jgi:hypothetical protein
MVVSVTLIKNKKSRARLFVFDKDLWCVVANCCRYGKVFKSHIFGSPTIVSTDADVNKFILQSDAKVFVPSYPKSLMQLMGESSILLINGTLQRRIHGLIGAFFKSQQLKVQITSDMQKYVQESMANWKEDQPIYIQDETKKVTSVSFPSQSLSVCEFAPIFVCFSLPRVLVSESISKV